MSAGRRATSSRCGGGPQELGGRLPWALRRCALSQYHGRECGGRRRWGDIVARDEGSLLNTRHVRRRILKAAEEPSYISDEVAVESSESNDGLYYRDILGIALPTMLALSVEPLSSLVSTAFVGHIGAAELAGVGVALSVYNSFTKLFNMPLLAIITSSIASSQSGSSEEDERSAIGRSIFLAVFVGVVQSVVLIALGPFGLRLYGAGEYCSPACTYLRVRTLGNAVTVLFVSLLGIFRGLGDGVSPLIATICFTCASVGLEYMFLFQFHMGTGGAALAVVMAQIFACSVALAKLSSRVSLGNSMASLYSKSGLSNSLKSLKMTGILMIRTLCISSVYAVATALVTRGGAATAAGHQIAFQIWLASSLLADSLAVAAQSLIARYIGSDAGSEGMVARTSLRLSVLLGLALTCTLSVSSLFSPLRLFTSDPMVLDALHTIFPAIIASQTLNSLAFVLDGILYGVPGGFVYAAKAMFVSAGPSIMVMLGGYYYCMTYCLNSMCVLQSVWCGLLTLMVMRMLTIMVPLLRSNPPFHVFTD